MIDTVSFYGASLETPFSKNLNLRHIRGSIVFGNGSWLDKVDAIEIVTERDDGAELKCVGVYVCSRNWVQVVKVI